MPRTARHFTLFYFTAGCISVSSVPSSLLTFFLLLHSRLLARNHKSRHIHEQSHHHHHHHHHLKSKIDVHVRISIHQNAHPPPPSAHNPPPLPHKRPSKHCPALKPTNRLFSVRLLPLSLPIPSFPSTSPLIHPSFYHLLTPYLLCYCNEMGTKLTLYCIIIQ